MSKSNPLRHSFGSHLPAWLGAATCWACLTTATLGEESAFKAEFLALCDANLGAVVDNARTPPGQGHQYFIDSYAVRALCVAYDLTAKKTYLDACRTWSDRMIEHQNAMTPNGAYYMKYGRAPGETQGECYVADDSSIAQGVLATAVRCSDPAEKRRYLASAESFAKLVIDEKIVRPSGGVANGWWSKHNDEWWCSTGIFGALAFSLYSETGEPAYLKVGLGAIDWLNKQDVARSGTFASAKDESPSLWMYSLEAYSAGFDHLQSDSDRYCGVMNQWSKALGWAEREFGDKGGSSDRLRNWWGNKLGGVPFHLYVYAGQVRDSPRVVRLADEGLRYAASRLKAHPEFQLASFAMFSYAEKVAPGKIYRTDKKLSRLQRLEYNNPGLTVDLGVGLWVWPVPMDFDGDGVLDLVISCPDIPHNGTYFFKNLTGNVPNAVFKPGVRISKGLQNVQASYVDGQCRILTPGMEYPDFCTSGLAGGMVLSVAPAVHNRRTRANEWKYVDYDGDGRLDLVVGAEDWSDYGWDNAFDAEGKWTHGPLHGLVYLLRNEGTNERPRYGKPALVKADGKPIDVFGMPSPNFADFTGNGRLDIICGSFVDKLTYFKNVGSRSNPLYTAGQELKWDGKPLRMDLCMIVPVAIDWDKDGRVDLVVGQEDGRIALMRNTGKVVDGVPVFEPPRFFQQQAEEVKFGTLVSPTSFDWDGDGREDLICGNSAGYIGLIRNLNGGDPPRWDAPKYLDADGEVIRIMAGPNGSIQGPCEEKWGYTTLSVADWDQDGLPDLVVNSIWGKVVWYRNVGTRRSPRLAASQPIEVEWPDKPPKPAWTWWNPKGKELVTQWRTRPVVIDLNGDGLNDLVMLDPEGYLAFFERTRRDGRLVLLPPRRMFVEPSGAPIQLNAAKAGKSGRRKICLVDWDLDGRVDLLTDSTSVDFWHNEGSRNGLIVMKRIGQMDPRRLAGHDTSPTVVHWSKDGVPDLVIGAEDGCLYLLRNPHRRQ